MPEGGLALRTGGPLPRALPPSQGCLPNRKRGVPAEYVNIPTGESGCLQAPCERFRVRHIFVTTRLAYYGLIALGSPGKFKWQSFLAGLSCAKVPTCGEPMP
jgi:hypothetical protein